MKHPPSRFAAPPSLAPSAWRGAHPAAWQSQFRGCPEGIAALASGSGLMRVTRNVMDN